MSGIVIKCMKCHVDVWNVIKCSMLSSNVLWCFWVVFWSDSKTPKTHFLSLQRVIKNLDVEEVHGIMVVEICIFTLPVGEICLFSQPFFQILLRRLGFQFFIELFSTISHVIISQHQITQHHITLNHMHELIECCICTLVRKDAVKCSVLQHLTASFITKVQMLHSRSSFEWLNVMWCWVMWSDVMAFVGPGRFVFMWPCFAILSTFGFRFSALYRVVRKPNFVNTAKHGHIGGKSSRAYKRHHIMWCLMTFCDVWWHLMTLCDIW
jgi:hypothetical protein